MSGSHLAAGNEGKDNSMMVESENNNSQPKVVVGKLVSDVFEKFETPKMEN